MQINFLTALFGTNSRPDITTTKQEAIPEKYSPSEPLSTVQTSRFDSFLGSDIERYSLSL